MNETTVTVVRLVRRENGKHTEYLHAFRTVNHDWLMSQANDPAVVEMLVFDVVEAKVTGRHRAVWVSEGVVAP
jgi:hypothetical protein